MWSLQPVRPTRTEEMSRGTSRAVIAYLAASPVVRTLNLTGLPPALEALEQDYQRHLAAHFDVVFNQLFTLANMPIRRFGSMLVSKGQFSNYMSLLRGAHREANLDQVMCRSLVSVDWQGYLYDCDINQQLGLPIRNAGQPRLHLSEITAGQASSCGGALGDVAATQPSSN